MPAPAGWVDWVDAILRERMSRLLRLDDLCTRVAKGIRPASLSHRLRIPRAAKFGFEPTAVGRGSIIVLSEIEMLELESVAVGRS